ncbi:restriction endonuclease subunit M [Terrabacter sp. 28]|nr:restriction endonuclease subunit M [Terrabacter sp. 28]
MNLVRSKQRVIDHGEVFTPPWVVEAMLDLVKGESERIDSRFLEPACGSGNFLVPVLQRKLVTVKARYPSADFERRHYALLALMCIYGIELLADNVAECRENLLSEFGEQMGLDEADPLFSCAGAVLEVNIVHGDALSMRAAIGQDHVTPVPITFPEWGYLGRGKFQRRDFRYDTLTQSSAFNAEGGLFADAGAHEVFQPTKTYPPMSISEIAESTLS